MSSVVMGNPLPARQVVRIPQRVAVLPSDACSLAVACGGRGVPHGTCPASPSARRPLALPLLGHDFGSLLRPARDPAPRPAAYRTPDLSSGPRVPCRAVRPCGRR